MKVCPANRLTGEIMLPGDKSISHRSVMMGSIAEGETRISNFATSADCASTIECFRGLGISIERDGGDVTVDGKGKHGLEKPNSPLDCGNSGSTMRLVAGILAGQPFDSVLTGDESLRSRPMKRIIDPLTAMGGQIESQDGRAPLTIRGRKMTGIEYRPPVASAQIKSCVLLAGLFADGQTTVVETTPTRDHTEIMLRQFGVDIDVRSQVDAMRISVSGDAKLRGTSVNVPGDISSAAFFMVAAASLAGSRLKLVNVGLNPTRSAVIDLLRRLGANVTVERYSHSVGEAAGDVIIEGGIEGGGSANVLSGPIIANVIDELPVLAVLGTQLEHGLEVRDARELRVKESDRIASVVINLKKMGADVEEFDDGFRVARSRLTGADVDSFGDHRIAMAFAVAGLLADGETTISGA
ncbi:MAG TPA: 3-phosphoshikimate 1-carboxyvinyltransferase, partial [Pyrinomonadaceae bacterium]|nr:3-phosphoshikimate 1-carboxyvinyltransferase [Pyrinomonadaceae bacterium]